MRTQGGFEVRTNEITNGVPSDGRPPVVQPAEEASELGSKFSQLIQQMIGGAGVDAMLGDIQGLSGMTVNVAPLPQKPVEVEKPKEEAVEQEELVVTEEKDSCVETDEDDEQPEEEAVVQTEEQAVVVQGVVLEQKPVELVAAEEAVTTEAITEEQVQEVARAVEPVAVQTQQVEKAEGEAFQIAQAQTPLKAKEHAVKETAEQAPMQAVNEAPAGEPVVKAEAVKTAVKDVSRQRSEDYFALQRAIEAANADSQGEMLPPEDGTKPVLPPQTVIGQAVRNQAAEGAAAQGALARAAGLQEQTTPSQNAKGQGAVVELNGAAVNNATKFTLNKLKLTKEVPAEDRNKVVEQVKELLKKAVQSRDGNSISVRLNPPELGQMTVKVTQRENRVYARIIPESQEVEAMLRQRANDVTQVLVAAGLKVDQVHVSIGRERGEGEAFQFQDMLGRGNAEQGGEQSRGKDEAGKWEQGAPMVGARMEAEELLADSGWVA